MPDRIIRESALGSATLGLLSDFAERLFWRLTTVADDYGRFNAHPSFLYGRCMAMVDGATVKKVEDAINQLAQAGTIALYEAEGKKLGHFPNWEKYQRGFRGKPKHPEPPAVCGDLRQLAATRGDLPPYSYSYSYSINDKNPTDSSAVLDSPATAESPGPPVKPSAEWADEDKWLKHFLETEQRTFNGHHLPALVDPEYWDQLSIATNGIDKPFVSREFAKMGIWLKNNPRRGPTPRGTRQFVAHWMQKAAEQERRRA